MAVCFSCALEHTLLKELPQSTKFHHIVGWTGKCGKCDEITTVYSNQDMGVNPDMRKDAPKH